MADQQREAQPQPPPPRPPPTPDSMTTYVEKDGKK